METSFSYGYWHFKDGQVWTIWEDKDGEEAHRVFSGFYYYDEKNNLKLQMEDGRKFTTEIGWLGFEWNETIGGWGRRKEYQECRRVLNTTKIKRFDNVTQYSSTAVQH